MAGRSRHALFSLLATCASVHAADGQRAPETFPLSIASQPLEGALQQLARQCDVQMVFFSRVTQGLSAPAIEGDYTLAAAMERLLVGSGLTFEILNPQTVEVRPAQAKPTDRSGSRETRAVSQVQQPSKDAGPLEEVVVIGLAEQLVATRIATPLREIPQTISIVTGEEMRQRNDVTLADVLEHSPGIAVTRDSSLDQSFYSRGYQITSFHIDGGAAISPIHQLTDSTNQVFLGTPDLIEFDHVEILRGADGLFTGNGNPGGTISLVRKRPQRNFAVAFNTTAGSWDSQRLELDITGPLGDGALRGRTAALYAREGYFYDIDPHEHTKVFGALEYDLTDAATLTAGASYQRDHASGVGNGVPLYNDGRDSHLPRDTTFDFDWTRYSGDLREVYLQYRQQLAPKWTVKLNAAGWRNEADLAYGYFRRPISPVTNAVNERPIAVASVHPKIHTVKTADLTLTGTLNWFGWREEVAAGADFTRVEVRSDRENWSSFGALLGDPRSFDPRNYPDPRLTLPPDSGAAATTTSDQYGLFASLRVYFDDPWSIVGGARFSRDDTDTHYTLRDLIIPPLAFAESYGTDHVMTPYAGLTYSFDRHYSLYASYSDIYLSQGDLSESTPGHLLGPIRGVNVEAGIKGEWRNGALNGLLAAYRIKQRNLAMPTEGTSAALPGVRNCCFVGVASESRGADVELSGELMPGWTLGAGYTYNENESPEGGQLAIFMPKHQVKAWTGVRLPGVFNRWQIGGSFLAQSETATRALVCSGLSCRLVEGVQPTYGVLDLRAGFDVDRNWQVSLSVNNVLDKRYYQLSDDDSLYVWYGEPRKWMLRVDARY